MSEIELLRQEVAELRKQVVEVDDWANGIQSALVAVFPFLLRGHPEVEKVAGLLRHHSDKFDELTAHPERAESSDESAGQYEAGKMLYRQLAILGVWPGIDALDAARNSLDLRR